MDRPADAKAQARPFDLLIVLVVGAALTALSIILAYRAYMGTSDVEDFRRFAEPGSMKHEAKSIYLFAPVLFEVAGLLGLLASLASAIPLLPQCVRDWLDPGVLWGRIEVYLLILFFVFCLAGTAVNSAHALHNLGLPTHGAGAQGAMPFLHRVDLVESPTWSRNCSEFWVVKIADGSA